MESKSEGLLLFKVAGALMLLLALTVGAAFLHLGAFNIPVALAIAVAKGLLVLYFFMELRHSRHLIWLFAAAGVLGLILLISGLLSDIFTRG
jgi:cytochrome c oxidase subunit IV